MRVPVDCCHQSPSSIFGIFQKNLIQSVFRKGPSNVDKNIYNMVKFDHLDFASKESKTTFKVADLKISTPKQVNSNTPPCAY
jgi:hypothetical protein